MTDDRYWRSDTGYPVVGLRSLTLRFQRILNPRSPSDIIKICKKIFQTILLINNLPGTSRGAKNLAGIPFFSGSDRPSPVKRGRSNSARVTRLKQNHTEFRKLLSANNSFLETMTDLEEKYLEQGFFDRTYIQRRVLRAIADIHTMIDSYYGDFQ